MRATHIAVAAATAKAATAGVGAVVSPTPASADDDAVCLGDYDGYRVQYVAPMHIDGDPSLPSYGQAILYYHPGKRCVYGKVSLPAPLRSGSVANGQLTKVTPDGRRYSNCSISLGSNVCLTEKFYDGGFQARMMGYHGFGGTRPHIGYTPWW